MIQKNTKLEESFKTSNKSLKNKVFSKFTIRSRWAENLYNNESLTKLTKYSDSLLSDIIS